MSGASSKNVHNRGRLGKHTPSFGGRLSHSGRAKYEVPGEMSLVKTLMFHTSMFKANAGPVTWWHATTKWR